MQIAPEKKRVSELLPIDSPIQYEIPIYQRNYSWGNTQIEQLLNDVIEEDSGYYLGNMLVTGDQNHPQIIDGQQRLTTLSLFLAAIADLLAPYEDSPSLKAKVYSRCYDIQRRLYASESDENPRINLLDRDKQIYSGILRMVFHDGGEKWRNRVLHKRYSFIKSQLAEVFSGADELLGFYEKLLSLEVLQISVPDVGDAFSVFSSLNSKGLPLTLIDLLKGEFISIAANSGNSADKVLGQWHGLTELFEQADADYNSGLVTQFLLNNYDAFEGKSGSITKGKALSKYRDQIKNHYRNGEDYLGVLIKRGRVFARIAGISEKGCKNAEIDQKLAVLQKLESTQALPLLLFIMVNEKGLELTDHMPAILEALIAFYVRRNVTLTPKSSNIRSRMLGVVRSIRDKGLRGKEAYSEIIRMLKEMSASDEQFYAALKQPIYDKCKSTARYILTDIERRVGKAPLFNKQYPDTLDDFVVMGASAKRHPRWTIEHILPEGSLPECWVQMIASGDAMKAEELQLEYMHKLGNLTLTPYNSELAQRPFANSDDPDNSKRDYRDKGNGTYVGLRSGLFLNRSIAGENESLDSKKSWTVEDIERRNDLLSDYVVELYPIPSINE